MRKPILTWRKRLALLLWTHLQDCSRYRVPQLQLLKAASASLVQTTWRSKSKWGPQPEQSIAEIYSQWKWTEVHQKLKKQKQKLIQLVNVDNQHCPPKELTTVYLTASQLLVMREKSNQTIPSPSPGLPCKKVLATAFGMLNRMVCLQTL